VAASVTWWITAAHSTPTGGKLIPLPSEKDWRVITYRPQPLYTRTSDYRALEYWQSVYGPNTSIEVNVEQDRLERDNFMGHLRSGIPIIVTPDPDKIECYAEPLATIHKQFWDAASAVVWGLPHVEGQPAQ
jgi:hypothetical protein